MRIAFLGKGGSGKTTTAAGFVRFVADRYPFVLALDADVNTHLASALGMSTEPEHLESHFDAVMSYLKGSRRDLGERPMLATTPPALRSNFIRVSPDDELIRRYALKDGKIALMAVGHYKESDLGASCYHTKLFGLAAVLHHMLDQAGDIVVADTTAGTDNLATSLWFAYDMNVFVVEPTEKAVRVYQDFIGVSRDVAEKTFVVGNKVESADDEKFIRSLIPASRYLGSIPQSRYLKRFEQVHADALESFRQEQAAAFQAVLNTLKSRKKEWDLYLKRLRETHSRICRDWFDDYYGIRLDENLDEEFSYAKVLSSPGKPGGKREDAAAARSTKGQGSRGKTVKSAQSRKSDRGSGTASDGTMRRAKKGVSKGGKRRRKS